MIENINPTLAVLSVGAVVLVILAGVVVVRARQLIRILKRDPLRHLVGTKWDGRSR